MIDLSAFAGKSVTLRFLFDTVDEIANAFEGWYVGDVRVYDELGAPPHGPGRESIPWEVAAVPAPQTSSTAGVTVALADSSNPGALGSWSGLRARLQEFSPSDQTQPTAEPTGIRNYRVTGVWREVASVTGHAGVSPIETTPDLVVPTANDRAAPQPPRQLAGRSIDDYRDRGSSEPAKTSDPKLHSPSTGTPSRGSVSRPTSSPPRSTTDLEVLEFE